MPEENKENLNQDVVKNGNPYNLVDHPENTDQTNENKYNVNTEKKESENFFKKLVRAIRKMAGLQDSEIDKSTKDTLVDKSTTESTDKTSVNSEITLEQDIVAQGEQKKEEDEKKKFSFENVMSGVTGVLDKIEKKVEEKTGLDLDAPLKKREERLNNQEGQTEPEIEVDQNNEEYLSENH